MVVSAKYRHESTLGGRAAPYPEAPLAPPSLPHPSSLSQSTGVEGSASCIELALVIYFTYGNIQYIFFKSMLGLPLVVQWLRLYTSNAGGIGLVLGQGTKVPECHTACLPHQNGQTKRNQTPHSSWKPHLTGLAWRTQCSSRTRPGLSSLPWSPSLSSILCLGCFAIVTPTGPRASGLFLRTWLSPEESRGGLPTQLLLALWRTTDHSSSEILGWLR